MRRIFFAASILAAVLLWGCVKEETVSQNDVSVDTKPQKESAIVEGQAYVLFDDQMTELIEADLQSGSIVTKSSELNGISAALGVKTMERLFPHAGEFEPRTRAAGLHKWYKVTFDESIPVTKAAGDFSALPGVELVEPVRKVYSTAHFNDPKLPQQWHYYNNGTGQGHKSGSDINVVPVWEAYTTGDSDVIVAIVDGGIDYNHEDLAANYVGGYNFVRNTTKIIPHDHGTHVAGTVAAVNNNGKGVSGVAGGDSKNGVKGVGLLSCQIFEPNPDDPNKDIGADGAPAIKWGADNGAVISQNSWGFTFDTEEEAAAANIPGHLKAAIDYFIANAGMDASGNQVGPMKGGVVIFASGNDGWAYSPICEYEPVITVGAIGPDFTRTYYSNYGDYVDLCAPGGASGGQVLSTLPGNKYGYMQGTSMACPHVSGVAALVVSHFKGKGFTNETLTEKLIKGADKSAISKNAKIGALVDAFGAMTYGGVTPPKDVASAEVKARSNNIDFAWKVTSDPDDKKAYGFILLVAKDKSLFNSINFSSLPAGVFSSVVMTGEAKVGDQISGTVTGLDFTTDYHAAVVAFDYNRNYSSLSPIYTVKTEGNNAPVVETSYKGDFKVKSHETLKVNWQIVDPDGHEIQTSFVMGSKAATIERIPDGSYQMTIVGNVVDPGVYEAVFTVTDSYGLAAEKKVKYEILENHAPVIVKEIDDMLFEMEGQKFSLDMSEYLSDPDGEQLKFTINITDRTVLHIAPKENILNATTLSYGVTDVSIVASDSRGLKCTLEFKVLIKDFSKPVEIFPNPVKDFMTISTMEGDQTNVKIVSSTGKVVYDITDEISAFYPATIDMRGCAPGVYKVTVAFGGNTYNRTIVKL